MKKKKGQLSLVSFGAEGQSNLNDHELEEYAPLQVEVVEWVATPRS